MEKKNLIHLITEILSPLGFKRKGNYWIANGTEINKSVDLQKSRYSNSFYINWGYIIKSLPLDGMKTHIFGRLRSDNSEEHVEIYNLLGLENDIHDETRAAKLEKYILEKIVSQFKEGGYRG